MTNTIQHAVEQLPSAPLTEEALIEHIHPLFSRVLRRQEIYLANHSLGRPLDRTAHDIREAVDLWYEDLDGAWNGWQLRMDQYRRGWASLIGSSRWDAVVPKTAAGQGLRAVLNTFDAPPSIVTTRGEFDSIDFILKTYELKKRASVSWVDAGDDGRFDADRVAGAISDSTDLVIVSAVIFASGQRIEGLDRIVRKAHDNGAMVLLDTYHAAGAMPMNVDALDVDFAIGGSYKYVRGAAGAGWLWINPRHLSDSDQPDLRTLDTGWFAKAGTMEFTRDETPRLRTGGDAWLESTPPVLVFVQALAGLELLNALGLDRVAAYNAEQQEYLATALEQQGVPLHLISPRGAFLTAKSDDPHGDAARLREAGVVVDARFDASGRGLLRFCPDLLNTRRELSDATEIAGSVLT